MAGLLATLLAVYATICAALFLAQRSLLYFPQPRSLGDHASSARLQAPDAELVLTVRPREDRRAVVYFGGNAEDVSASLPDLAATFPERALYLLHYRGYGGSSGRPTEQALHQDALLLFDRVRAQHEHVTVIGRSLGSGVAIRLATLRPVSRLVLVTPYDSIVELAARQFPFVPVRWLLQDRYESWRYAPRVQAPTTIVVAGQDEVIPPQSALRLHARFPPGVAEAVVIPDAGHGSVSDSAAYRAAVRGRALDGS